MQTLPDPQQKWVASVTCAAAAIFMVLAGICQQLIAKWEREWDMPTPAIADYAGFSAIVGLFLLVIAANIVMFLWSHWDELVGACSVIAIATAGVLGFILVQYGAFILRILFHSPRISP